MKKIFSLFLLSLTLVSVGYLAFAQVVDIAEPIDQTIEPVITPDPIIEPEPVDTLEIIDADFYTSKYSKEKDLTDTLRATDFIYKVILPDSTFYLVHSYAWDKNSSACIDLPEYSLVVCGSFLIKQL